MVDKQLYDAVIGYKSYVDCNGIDEDVIYALTKACEVAMSNRKDIEYALGLTGYTKKIIKQYVLQKTGGTIWDLEKYQQDNNTIPYEILDQYYDVLKLESYDKFESFILYMERNRHYKKRFYQPRQKTLHIVVDDLQWLEDDENALFYGLSMPSRVGKSTICIFFLAWVSVKRPNNHNAMGGHSGILAKGFYKELLNFMTSEDYTFQELFFYWNPKYKNKTYPTDKSADDFTITLGDPDRFATITCRGIDGTWTGAVDVSKGGYLYVDDLVRDREHSLSPIRMENTYQEYLNKMVDRKNDGAKELMVGTLWNVLDPLERLRKDYEGKPGYRFRRIPALDEKDESNFNYDINGFSSEYYRDMREKLDRPEWEAKYQQRPFVREGLLFPTDELRYFDGLIDDEHERSVIALCDPAFGGADSLSMPICLQDETDKLNYIIAWVHKRGTQAVTVPLIVDAIIKHYITELHIEQNAGGKLLTDSIKAEMDKRDVRHCRIVPYYASTRMPKTEKIKAYSDWIKKNFIFLLPNKLLSEHSKYRRGEQYDKALEELTMYTSEGKNPHDDAPDSLSQLAIVMGKQRRQTTIMHGYL